MTRKKQKNKGWKNEPGRHALAARGVKTKNKNIKYNSKGKNKDLSLEDVVDAVESIGDVGKWKIRKRKDYHGNLTGIGWLNEETYTEVAIAGIGLNGDGVNVGVPLRAHHGRYSVVTEVGMIAENIPVDEALQTAVDWMKDNQNFDDEEVIAKGSVGDVEYKTRWKDGIIYYDPDDKRKQMDTESSRAKGIEQIAKNKTNPERGKQLVEQGLATRERPSHTYKYQLTDKGKDVYKALQKSRSELENKIETTFPEGRRDE